MCCWSEHWVAVFKCYLTELFLVIKASNHFPLWICIVYDIILVLILCQGWNLTSWLCCCYCSGKWNSGSTGIQAYVQSFGVFLLGGWCLFLILRPCLTKLPSVSLIWLRTLDPPALTTFDMFRFNLKKLRIM